MSTARPRSEYASELANDGVVVIPEYLSEAECDDLRTRIEDRLDSGDIDVATDDMSYADMAAADRTILNQREGDRDDGMLDIFNMDSELDDLSRIKGDDFINDIIDEAAGAPYSPDNLNIYLNKSVTNTRGYHADTYSGKYKSFVYLTDVPSDAYGPFSYVKGSHDTTDLKKKATILVNKLRNQQETDAIWYDTAKAVNFTATRGTLIIANQRGYHRGIPQESGKERMLVSTSYTPE